MPINIYDKEFQNWLKGVFALNTTREVLCKCIIERFTETFIKTIPGIELEQFFLCLYSNGIAQLKTKRKGTKRWKCQHNQCHELMRRFVDSHTEKDKLKSLYQWTLTQAPTDSSKSDKESIDVTTKDLKSEDDPILWHIITLYMFVEKSEKADEYKSLDNLDVSKVVKVMMSCEIFNPDGSLEWYESVKDSRNELMHSSKNQMTDDQTRNIIDGAVNLLKCLDTPDITYFNDATIYLKELQENDFVIKYQSAEYKQILAKVFEAKDIAVKLHNAIDDDNHECKSQSRSLQEMLEKISGPDSTIDKRLEFKPSEYKSIVKDSLEKKQETITQDKSACEENSKEFIHLQELEEKAGQDVKDIEVALEKPESEEVAELVDHLNEKVKTLQEDKKKTEDKVKTYEDENKALKERNSNLQNTIIYSRSVQPVKQKSATVENMSAPQSMPYIHGYDKFDGYQMEMGMQVEDDIAEYRNGYPGQEDNPNLNENYQFYMNEIPSKPQGDFIDNIHKYWWGDYTKLEDNRKYMQWLFPVRRKSCNREAQVLQPHEIQKIQSSEEAMGRLLTSYKMMLDFYGMKIKNEADGTIVRAENWKERFENLNGSDHNYMRITRILKCLGEFGYEHLKKNFTKFILKEAIQKTSLPNLIKSCLDYWIPVLKVASERAEVEDYYRLLTRDSSFKSI